MVMSLGPSPRSALPAYGIRLPNSGPFASADGLIGIAGAADALGYQGIWVHDHISWSPERLTHFAAGSFEACADQDPNFFESVSTVAYLAGRFPRLHVGVAGLVLPLRDPRVLAKQLSTLDNLAPGGLTVAVAIGNIPNDFHVLGLPYKRRARMTEDYLGALSAILNHDAPVQHAGDFITFDEGTFLPKPAGLRVWLAGSSDPGLQRVVRYGDGWLTVYQSLSGYRELANRLNELADTAGRDPATIDRGYETFVSVAGTQAEAVAAARESIMHSFGDLDRGMQVCLIGTPVQITERIEQYRAEGVDHFELKFYCRSLEHMREQMGTLAETLLPHAAPTAPLETTAAAVTK